MTVGSIQVQSIPVYASVCGMVEETRAAEVSRKEQLFYYSEHLLLILLHLQDEHTGSFSPT